MNNLRRKANLYLSIEKYIKDGDRQQNQVLINISSKEMEEEVCLIVRKAKSLPSLKKAILESRLWFIYEAYLKTLDENLIEKELQRVLIA